MTKWKVVAIVTIALMLLALIGLQSQIITVTGIFCEDYLSQPQTLMKCTPLTQFPLREVVGSPFIVQVRIGILSAPYYYTPINSITGDTNQSHSNLIISHFYTPIELDHSILANLTFIANTTGMLVVQIHD